MKTAEIKKRWLNFFNTRGHEIVKSHSLISPDPSTLFTIAGMVPFIPYMTAIQKAPFSRATSVQKCVRTADIEEVGKTTRHGTFFQMNGNFSFGDYFKEDAIKFAWEFLTGEQSDGNLGFSKDKIWVTVWGEDDEAYNHWINTGIDIKHIQKRDKKENFWSTGGPGPAGPCSEIFFDRGAEFGEEGGPIHDDLVGTERYLEIWNLVFMQWQIDSVKSKYDFNIVGDLKQKNIDTGMGLERVAFLLQNKDNIYEIDEIFPVIKKVEELTGKKYGDNTDDDVHFRILADHIRSSLMIISDGVTPNNEGRGYVLRRLLRRSIRSIRLLGFDGLAFESLFETSKNAMKDSYPELEEKWDVIKKVVINEETVFSKTLKDGSAFLSSAISSAGKGGKITGADAFRLHDTHGFPVELTLEIASEHGVKVDQDVFRELMQEQRDRARTDALKKRGAAADVSLYSKLAKDVVDKIKPSQSEIDSVIGNNAGLSKFLGYHSLESEVQIVGIITNQGAVPSIGEDDEASKSFEIILNQTPFYAQSGGQLADQGSIIFYNGAQIEVDDVQKPIPELSVHRVRLISGKVCLDDKGIAKVDAQRRGEIAKAHTATHMIHRALHEFVGKDATQSGSENSPGRSRFDFKANDAINAETLSAISERVNQKIRENYQVFANKMPIKDAQKSGAMALFGEKYGNEVRVVSLGDEADPWSVELCGGTHVKNTGEIGNITILSEGSIGSGIRRIDTLVGAQASQFQAKEHALVGQISNMLGTKDPDEIQLRINQMMQKLKSQERDLAKIQEDSLRAKISDIIKDSVQKTVSSSSGDVLADVISANLGEVPSGDIIRNIVLDIRSRVSNSQPVIIALVGVNNEKPIVVVATNQEARDKGIKAGSIVRDMSKILGGGGGGKDDLAQGGGVDISKIEDALGVI